MTPLQLARALEPILGLRWTIETHRDGGVRAEGPGGVVLFTRGRRVELGERVVQAWRVAAIPALVSRWLDEGAVLSPGLEGDIQNGRAKSHLGAPWSTTENDSMIDTTIYPGAPSGGNPLNDPRAAAWLRLWHPGAWPWLLADPEEGRGLRACAGVRRDWLVWWSERWAVLPEALRADWLTAAVEGGDRGV